MIAWSTGTCTLKGMDWRIFLKPKQNYFPLKGPSKLPKNKIEIWTWNEPGIKNKENINNTNIFIWVKMRLSLFRKPN